MSRQADDTFWQLIRDLPFETWLVMFCVSAIVFAAAFFIHYEASGNGARQRRGISRNEFIVDCAKYRPLDACITDVNRLYPVIPEAK